MARQTVRGPVTWIVVDDGAEMTPIQRVPGWRVVQVRPEPYWEAGQNTLARNLLAGLARWDRESPVVIVEDDDWYAPDWLAHAARGARRHDLYGESPALFYNLANGTGLTMRDQARQAPLCATAMGPRAVECLEAVCRESWQLIDRRLWKQFPGKTEPGARVVGIKGLPGRQGIGAGHKLKGEPSPLSEWVGPEDAALIRAAASLL